MYDRHLPNWPDTCNMLLDIFALLAVLSLHSTKLILTKVFLVPWSQGKPGDKATLRPSVTCSTVKWEKVWFSGLGTRPDPPPT